ncbi:ATP-binding cassette domain-containing protein [Desulforhopalus singaporensis]|uniref:Molybdate transport system ATP-binding protein n=1 Tax=Desulforhopalus singaporensis TaxID=91360 RepID=A0A1H0L248_9BACT|nr:ATP-binding cassette domain-containing protein [Desulforhopalus singaporensis]SDO62307.1 molybdate transport system ATP-binding protein [Desulforhopalus singaporensis]
MYIKNFSHPELQIDELVVRSNESWCVYGGNDSGIDILLDFLTGRAGNYSVGQYIAPVKPGIISFANQQIVFERELRNDDTDFLDRVDPGTRVYEFLPGYRDFLPLLRALDMERCLDLGYRQLSSGQCRKLLILEAIITGASTLILQDPYDGLDHQSCIELNQALVSLPGDVQTIVFVNNLVDIPEWCSHLALIKAGRLCAAGLRKTILPELHGTSTGHLVTGEKKVAAAPPPTDSVNPDEQTPGNKELIKLRNGFAGYGKKMLFSGLNLTVCSGDHTLISGHNGCGKSTLLDILVGDNPKCYANDLHMFGKKRGTGESVWEIKSKIGMVSPSLHRDHRSVGTAMHVVLSGLHDSIGLYRKIHTQQLKKAQKWLAWINLADKANHPFGKLTYAQQRLVLVARALIKLPDLLVLDEPTQGLDDINRAKVLDFLQLVSDRKLSTILFVTHRRDEHRDFFKHHIKLDSYKAVS